MSDRFDELEADAKDKPKVRCPKCGSRNFTADASMDMGIVKLGPNWLRCLECDSLFIKNADDIGPEILERS